MSPITRLTSDHLALMSDSLRFPNANMNSIIQGLQLMGARAGLDQPVALAQHIAQTGHESMGWVHDREVWGPTKAQKGYEGREDLGNIYPGDGAKFRGYTGTQITGRANTTEFREWCKSLNLGFSVPDFVETPALMNTDPWEGLGPIWYWMTRDLQRYALQGNLEAITRRVNGGTNGLADRYRYYSRAALVLLGFGPADVKGFQLAAGFTGKEVDGIPGMQTRAAMHLALQRAPLLAFGPAPEPAPQPSATQPPAAEPSEPLGLLLAARSLHDALGVFIDKLKEETSK